MPKPILTRASLLLLILIPGGYHFYSPPSLAACDAFELKLEIRNSTETRKTGSVEAIVTGAEKPIYFFFSRNNQREMLSVDFAESKIENVEPGTYHCMVVDHKGCAKNTDFKIE